MSLGCWWVVGGLLELLTDLLPESGYSNTFDEDLTQLVARLSSTVVVTSLAIYTFRDNKGKGRSMFFNRLNGKSQLG